MKNGYYLSAYIHINELSHLLDFEARNNQNISLWYKDGEKVQLTHYWQLEKITGIKNHNRAFYNIDHAMEVIEYLLNTVNITLDDIVEIWGTPQLHTNNDYHSIDDYKNISYHCISHLFYALFNDTKKLQDDTTIGLVFDCMPDGVIEYDICTKKKNFYCGGIVTNESIEILPISSPMWLWRCAMQQYQLDYFSLLSICEASKSEAFPIITEIPSIKYCDDLSRAFYLFESIVNEIEAFTEFDTGKKFNYYDNSFSKHENNISMVVKELKRITYKIISQNIECIVDQYSISPGKTRVVLSGEGASDPYLCNYIMNQHKFKEVTSLPCADDSGQSIGIALYAFYKRMPQVNFKMRHYSYGDRNKSINQVLNKSEFENFIKSVSDFNMDELINDLKESIIIWVYGRADIGERSLGNRSILGDPRSNLVKSNINKIKKVPSWTPVPSVILANYAKEWLYDGIKSSYNLNAYNLCEDRSDYIPSALHNDNTIWAQIISANDNYWLYKIMNAFMKYSDVPILCNTTLSYANQPEVHTNEETVNFALMNNIGVIYINKKRIVLKNHDSYIPRSNLRPVLPFLKHTACEEYDRCMKELNPYDIPLKYLYLYFNDIIPKIKHEYDFTNRDDAQRLVRTAQIYERLYAQQHNNLYAGLKNRLGQ